MARAAAAKASRVHEEPAFVLHRHDWSESSLILEVFSRHHGRVALVAKGVKRPTSQFRSVLLALWPLRLSWGGATEVRTLKAAHWPGGQLLPPGEALLAGYYLNELLLKLLAREDPHPTLFDHYAQALALLAAGAPQAGVLRAFELLLLGELGWLPALDHDSASLQPLRPHGRYQLQAQGGLREVAPPDGEVALPDGAVDEGGRALPDTAAAAACSADHWLALHAALQAEAVWPALLPLCQQDRSGALRRQLRAALHYHSGVREFQTRRWAQQVQRLAGHRMALPG
ncbi:MAG: DNA repair protein RecO [Pseudomonadota bacterium]|jgi:DNA repair protein RecO (recombination protein O)